jgi:hypothetical protein
MVSTIACGIVETRVDAYSPSVCCTLCLYASTRSYSFSPCSTDCLSHCSATPTIVQAGLATSITLEVGDLLYIPRGVAHSASTNPSAHDAEHDSADEMPSMHVSFGIEVEPSASMRGLLHIVAHSLIESEGEATRFHRALTRFFIRLRAMETYAPQRSEPWPLVIDDTAELVSAAPGSSTLRELCPVLLSARSDGTPFIDLRHHQRIITVCNFALTHPLFAVCISDSSTDALTEIEERACADTLEWIAHIHPSITDKSTSVDSDASSMHVSQAADDNSVSHPTISSASAAAQSHRWHTMILDAVRHHSAAHYEHYQQLHVNASRVRNDIHTFLLHINQA